jgi:hypothetical protein
MRVLKTEDCFYVAGGNASDTNTGGFGDVGNMGASPCGPNDTAESCAARTSGYEMCAALARGMRAAASLSGNSAAQTLASEIESFCQNAVNNAVDWAYRTQMYERRSAELGISVGYAGCDTSSN